MVLGEPQILGQVKEAFALASSTGTVGPLLGRCFERTFSVAKRGHEQQRSRENSAQPMRRN